MGEVIDDYQRLFSATQAFANLPLDACLQRRDPFFTATQTGVTSYKAKLQLDKYVIRFWQQNAKSAYKD